MADEKIQTALKTLKGLDLATYLVDLFRSWFKGERPADPSLQILPALKARAERGLAKERKEHALRPAPSGRGPCSTPAWRETSRSPINQPGRQHPKLRRPKPRRRINASGQRHPRAHSKTASAAAT